MTGAVPARRVLLTGAAGKTGRAVVKRLLALETGRPRVRALVRTAEQGAGLRDRGVHEISVGDMLERTALETALRDVEAVYHICPNVHPEEESIGRRMIDLATRAGARRFVFHSVLEPGIRAMPHHWAKRAVEIRLAETDLDFTILQPAPYMQNVLAQWAAIHERGAYSVPYAPATRVSMVDLEDVAEAAARILTRPGHTGATYELCASDLLDQTEIAAVLSRALQREIRVEVVARGAWAATAEAGGMSRYQVETLLAMFDYYELSRMIGSSRPLETLLGRSPTSFQRFVERQARERPSP